MFCLSVAGCSGLLATRRVHHSREHVRAISDIQDESTILTWKCISPFIVVCEKQGEDKMSTCAKILKNLHSVCLLELDNAFSWNKCQHMLCMRLDVNL